MAFKTDCLIQYLTTKKYFVITSDQKVLQIPKPAQRLQDLGTSQKSFEISQKPHPHMNDLRWYGTSVDISVY